jgi:phosphohistidine phosphatase
MKLYFFRHAEAEPSTTNDFERRLTPRGVSRTEAAGRVLLRLGVAPTYLFSSPRVRARETAGILGETLGVEITVTEGVDSAFDLDLLARLVELMDDDDEVMFVGHEPTFSGLVGDLTGGEVVMKKGGMARVDLVGYAPPLEGVLVWLIPPKLFDLLDE